ncbi:hypothetical protein PG993_007031 [Apiospora rasikravindrae]|uniref:Uncharacterized protein n=1 Tax=Apiospora rasikravindrae TaxID=990691 RepID=A0ABR1SWC6_9PEZI
MTPRTTFYMHIYNATDVGGLVTASGERLAVFEAGRFHNVPVDQKGAGAEAVPRHVKTRRRGQSRGAMLEDAEPAQIDAFQIRGRVPRG